MPAPRSGPLLALDTTTARTSVALWSEADGVAIGEGPEGVPTASCLVPTIDRVLGDAGLRLEDVAAFAVAVGPGSFTGLRIGVATVKGLAFGSGRPALAISSLAALALAAPPGEGPVLATLDARRGELYAAAFSDPATGVADALPEGLVRPEDLAAHFDAGCRVVGEGVSLLGEPLRQALGPTARLETGADPWPHAREVAGLGARALAAGEGIDPADLAPRYVRRAQAEVLRTGLATEREGAL